MYEVLRFDTLDPKGWVARYDASEIEWAEGIVRLMREHDRDERFVWKIVDETGREV